MQRKWQEKWLPKYENMFMHDRVNSSLVCRCGKTGCCAQTGSDSRLKSVNVFEN
ncbi:hypothetical protein HanIR_Chr07g0311751 [Helianthus annuus]|nr:hypothetical protein HanIR_Chr07g0311751 [Helianthus annuus]